LSINTTLKESSLGFKDILLFVPGLANTLPFKNNQNAILQVNGRIFGKLNEIQIPSIAISGIAKQQWWAVDPLPVYRILTKPILILI
jgi:hypothetical protein